MKTATMTADGVFVISRRLNEMLYEYLINLLECGAVNSCPACGAQIVPGSLAQLGVNHSMRPALRLAHASCSEEVESKGYVLACQAELEDRAENYWERFGRREKERKEQDRQKRLMERHQEKKARRARLAVGKDRRR